jgi:hypothetical protein
VCALNQEFPMHLAATCNGVIKLTYVHITSNKPKGNRVNLIVTDIDHQQNMQYGELYVFHTRTKM